MAAPLKNGAIHTKILSAPPFWRKITLIFAAALLYNHGMKIFKYKFTKLIYALIGVILVLSVAGFAITLWQVIDFGIDTANPTFTIIRYILMFIVTIALIVILISLLISSYYAVDAKSKTIKTSFGFIKSSYDIKTIDTVMLDRTTNKLTVVFEDEHFIVIVVKEEWYEDFVQAILDVNPKIEYTIKSKTSTNDDEKNA